ncbi:MAG: hypothetical protein O2958_06520 [Gemmatimonadetes bacterium]|nr:hypothetical protein [Gemmatimonadota bacterium]MDA1103109.1 hypothetical protein [Gemmatimonadota bacterium]
MDVQVDRRTFLAAVGVGAIEAMSPEDRAEELEHYMMHELDESVTPKLDGEESALIDLEQQAARPPRGTGNLFMPREDAFEPMPRNPTLEDFFRLRFAPATHVLQSAQHALETGQPESTIIACLLHDVVLNLIKVDHGWWGAQLVEPYVDEKVTWGIRYHAALRFYPDDSVGYEYPELYNRIFGEDYVPEPYIREQYDFARQHPWYMEARMITVNDTYGFQEGVRPELDQFIDIIGRNFKQPKEGLGYDNSPVAHMWRTIASPNKPL